MKNEYISNWQSAKVFAQMAEIERGQEIYDTLVAMAQRKGREDSETIAARIMSGVYAYENTREVLETSVEDAVAPLFEKLSERTPEEQAAALDQILFGFEAVGDDALFRQTMADSEKAYADHRGDIRFGSDSVETLKAELVKKMGNMNLSPKAMDRMIAKLAKSGDYTATAAALGRRGFALKSVAAMATYLDAGEGADITEAVTGACASMDMQAVGDAVNRGLMARKAARIILGVIVIVTILLIFWACIESAMITLTGAETLLAIFGEVNLLKAAWHTVAALLAARSVLELDTVLEPYVAKAGDLAGQLTVLLSGLVRKGREAVENGLKAVFGSISIPADDAETIEEPELDWELNEDPDCAF